MTVAELALVATDGIKIVSGYDGRVLCYAYNPKKHEKIGERTIIRVVPDLKIINGFFNKQAVPELVVYVDGTVELLKEMEKRNDSN